MRNLPYKEKKLFIDVGIHKTYAIVYLLVFNFFFEYIQLGNIHYVLLSTVSIGNLLYIIHNRLT